MSEEIKPQRHPIALLVDRIIESGIDTAGKTTEEIVLEVAPDSPLAQLIKNKRHGIQTK